MLPAVEGRPGDRAGQALASCRAVEAVPGPAADADDALRRYADQMMASYFHPVGTLLALTP
ncbi:MAG: hypothetical protein JWM19_2020 [Actinomycetia bacterium]|nr:hypothetical protein [Actinomycetes bacterium]